MAVETLSLDLELGVLVFPASPLVESRRKTTLLQKPAALGGNLRRDMVPRPHIRLHHHRSRTNQCTSIPTGDISHRQQIRSCLRRRLLLWQSRIINDRHLLSTSTSPM
eukprot:XP_001704578.1 Hypothetical protein GL50803_92496 [Giardia lamblia ATCC 50803]